MTTISVLILGLWFVLAVLLVINHQLQHKINRSQAELNDLQNRVNESHGERLAVLEARTLIAHQHIRALAGEDIPLPTRH